MAPKRKAAGSGPTPAGRRSTSQGILAFHGHVNKVSKASRRSLDGKDSDTKKTTHNSTVRESAAPSTAVIKPDLDDSATSQLSTIDTTETEVEKPISPEEKRARSISEAQIKKYWKERKAPSVHQESLSLHEKVCRNWDTDGRYGPCMGIPRIKRWKRAQTLGLQPPIEVLAILLKVQDAGNVKAQRAHMDELMGARLVEA